MVNDLKEAYSLDNLRRAWNWINSNPDAFYKGYFRDIYRAYSISSEAHLVSLRNKLIKGAFTPTHVIKLLLPKKSGIQRPYSLLAVEDQIVYQALVNVVAERLLPRVKGQYEKVVFGNLYAGQHSRFFYRKWEKGYSKFNKEIISAYKKGFIYTASFDLTACYDSIDHSVISHFLDDLGLQPEFSTQLCNYLKHWTAAKTEKRIYQGHGIPQGSLASGLLSEVVLKYFDENRSDKPRMWKYFRYVDDMRFFAKNEHDLRQLLIEMDILSKQVGLFPQSSKIEIHKVIDIYKEIKSISNPFEPLPYKPSPDQNKIKKRLVELSPHFEVDDATKFKYVLGSAKPSAEIGARLLRVLEHNPQLFVSIFNYFTRFDMLPPKLSLQFLDLLKKYNLYYSFTAAGLRTLNGRCHSTIQNNLEKYSRSLLSNNLISNDTELTVASHSVLFSNNRYSWTDARNYILGSQDWWARAELIKHVDINHYGEPSYQFLVNELLKDSDLDVAVVSAELFLNNSLQLMGVIGDLHHNAQLTLREAKVIGKISSKICPISVAMVNMLGNLVQPIKWKNILGSEYKNLAIKAAQLRAYSQSDATAWVLLLDTLHDALLRSLFFHEAGSLGTYTKIGGAINDSKQFVGFHAKYPLTVKAFKMIHNARYDSALAHPVNQKTNQPTFFLEFKFIPKAKPHLAKAYIEIWNNW